ncbi:endonuclease MutS2 [Lentilactobacillus kisonensis]|uniref:Endonuclease MutS2 n=1 Tax=Lentilactobacillus kisonensis DSM 19906 = JCM 15041 TaxID=1423766 RepID=A0A0R1NPJ1_9LACO|nr:endonuclease MutS2 [Lentilactobacillus kisonensis]KRL21836.1 MutS2 family protein [Lentilactobacillus kisonensis DSM 19906 = JCM 15041]
MNEKVLETLEYGKIKQQLAGFLTTDRGNELLDNLRPSADFKVVNDRLNETADGADIVRLKGEIPIPKLSEISPYMKRLRIEEASLSGTELAHITKLLRAVQIVSAFFDDLKAEEVNLRIITGIVDKLTLMPTVTKRMMTSVDDDGRVLDSASSELRAIRKSISRTQTDIRTKMGKFIKGSDAKYLSEPIITVRDDRFVLPIRADYKQNFGGIVHDQSASGQTLYVEPSNVVEMNNQLRRDQLAERAEVRRILGELTNLLRPYRNELMTNMNLVGQLDFVNAKAKYAHQTGSIQPRISKDNVVNLRKARHPMIDRDKVVANDIEIGDKYSTIIVTGPNTGGKTITMKTIGLLQLMGQSGLFITANEDSQIGAFDEVFADIGDEQSIEANLSTFSSHMDNIISMLDKISNNSLVLLDELGAGTDPKEGAALAMAIIDAIHATGCELIATTHYPELKAFAYNRSGIINASMEFDVNTLRPTYRFLMGIPGQSNALNIAQKLGFPKQIIDNARSFTDSKNQDINNMIAELTAQTKRAHDEADQLQKQLAESTKLHQELTNQFNKYQAQRDRLTEQAQEKANRVVEEAKQQADKIIADLHQKQKQIGKVAIKENELIDAKGELNKLEVAPNLKKNKVLTKEKEKHNFHTGDDVLVKSYGQQGTLIGKEKNGTWDVQIGILKMKIDEADIEKIAADKQSKPQYQTHVSRTRSSGISPTLDLRGHRYEEAMFELDRYIDSALLAGYPSVTIIHGKGTGALRKGVTDYLKRNKRVKSFGYSAPNAGGDGSTIVKF